MLSFIRENYQSDITLNDISRHIHICKSGCYRVFKGYVEESLFGYLLKHRVKKSILDVLEGKLAMTETALGADLADPNYPSKVSHKIKGCPPRTYRKTRSSTRSS